MDILIALVVAGIVMGILDTLWLGGVAKKFYHQEIGHLLRKKPNMTAALTFYSIYVIGVVAFVVQPALAVDSLGYAASFGALLGFVAYATYDLTNLATIKNFSAKLVVVDLVWGMIITSVMAMSAYGVVQWIG